MPKLYVLITLTSAPNNGAERRGLVIVNLTLY